MFTNALERTIATVEAENSALRERQPYRIGELHARKTLVLYELERMGAVAVPPDSAAGRVRRLREVLDENRRLLKLNITALGEVIDTLNQLRIGEESDGTYSARSVAGGSGR